MKKFCTLLPKIELHAHLNGSIRLTTLQDLVKTNTSKTFTISPKNKPNLSECFQIFNTIHQVTNTPEALKRITTEMVIDYCSENVHYLEIRSTPKTFSNTFSIEDYINLVIQSIKEAQKICEIKFKKSPPIVKYLVSLDRSKGKKMALDILKIVKKLKNSPYICGVELSGNPEKGNIKEEFEDLLKYAKNELGMKLSLHLGEIKNNFEENQILLNLLPDRVGHATFLSSENLSFLMKAKIPVEICVTSNMVLNYKNIEDHHFKMFYDKGHPVVLCCDDRGVFFNVTF